MSKILLLLVAAVIVVLAASKNTKPPKYDPNDENLFSSWEKVYKPKYKDDDDKKARKEIFKHNADTVNKLNEESEAEDDDDDRAVFKLGEHAHLTAEEFAKTRLGNVLPRGNTPKRNMAATFTSLDLSKIPRSINWKKKGKVSKVKNQGSCGSCWAFSTTGAIESAWAIAKRTKPPLVSEQQLVDCVPKTGPCEGQWMGTAMDYIIKAHGIHRSNSYPYRAKAGKCRRFAGKIGAKIKSWTQFPQQYLPIVNHVGKVGPVSAVVDATMFQHYSHGVYTNARRCGKEGNHAILIVGYGHTAKGKAFWLIKNSWGGKWGMNGYFQLGRGNNNVCGINNFAVVPVI